jgi:hypothetical protein
MRMALLLPALMTIGFGAMYLLFLAAKYLPDWAYFGLFLVVLPAAIGAYFDYRSRSKSHKIKLPKG